MKSNISVMDSLYFIMIPVDFYIIKKYPDIATQFHRSFLVKNLIYVCESKYKK